MVPAARATTATRGASTAGSPTGTPWRSIDRGDYYQIAYLIQKGTDAQMRAEGVDALRRNVAALVPWLADRVDELTSLDDVKLLDVQLNRLRRWYT